MRWSDLLRVDRDAITPAGAVAMTRWLRKQFADNRPYDAFVRDIVTARGNPADEGPAAIYQRPRHAGSAKPIVQPGLPRRAHPVRPVPPSPVRALGPGRLLCPGRLLHRHRPQGRRCTGRDARSSSSIRGPSWPPAHRQAGAGQGARCGPRRFYRHRRSPGRAGALDDGRRQPVLRPGHRQPPLGALLRPRPGRAARRPAGHQPRHQRAAPGRAGQALARVEVRPESLHAHPAELAPLPAQRADTAGQRRRRTELLPRRSRRPFRPRCCWTPSARRPACRRSSTAGRRATGRSRSGTTACRRTSSASSAGLSAPASANANGATSRASPRPCT